MIHKRPVDPAVTLAAPTPHSDVKRSTVLIVIGACIAAALAISYFVLMRQSLRLDEAQSLWQSSFDLHGIIRVVAQDVHVPLYHFLLHFWQLYFGSSVTAARSLSLLFFVATIPCIYLLGAQVVSKRVALLATAFFSLSPFMNWYGNEIRMYSLLTLITVLNQYYFVRIIKRRQDYSWVGYLITGLLGIYSHYFFLFHLMTQAVFFFVYRRKFPQRSFRKLVAVAAVLVAALTPWVYHVYKLNLIGNSSPHLPKPTTVDFFNTYSQFLFGFQTNAINTVLVSFWPLMVLVSLVIVGRKNRLSTPLAYLAFAMLVPVLGAFGSSFIIKPFFLSRYLVVALPAVYIVLAWFLSRFSKPVVTALVTTAFAVLTVTSYLQYVSTATPVKEDYQSVTSMVEKTSTARDLVLVSSPFTVYPISYYYHGDAQLLTIPNWNRDTSGAIPPFSTKSLEAELATYKTDHQYAYVILSYDQGYEKSIKTYFDTHFEQVASKTFTPDLTLYKYRLNYKPQIRL